MDPYALKHDNRKKFRDKQLAKQRHATPSDRKYRALKRQQQDQESEREPPPQPSNEHRYLEDVTLVHAHEQSKERDAYANQRVKELLRNKQCPEIDEYSGKSYGGSQSGGLTKKELDRMDVTDLNKVLGRSQSPRAVRHINDDALEPQQSKNDSRERAENESVASRSASAVPADLEGEQDFLDGII